MDPLTSYVKAKAVSSVDGLLSTFFFTLRNIKFHAKIGVKLQNPELICDSVQQQRPGKESSSNYKQFSNKKSTT